MTKKEKDPNLHNKADKCRIYPNDKQLTIIKKMIGSARWYWNRLLSCCNENGYCDMTGNTIPELKEDYPWLKEADSLSFAATWTNLKQAFKNHRDNPEHFDAPTFKKKRKSRNSYTTYVSNKSNPNIRLSADRKRIKLPKIGWIKIVAVREVPDTYVIKGATISIDAAGEVFCSILYEWAEEIAEQNDLNKSIGLDFSMKELYRDSNNYEPQMPRFYRKAERKLAKAQRTLSRRYVEGAEIQSNRYYKQQRKVEKINVQIANQRSDFQHKLSRKMVNEYDYIFIEDLNMHAMAQSLNFGKSVHDNAWGQFTRMLAYKAEWAGKHVIKISRWYPSSKTCHVCGCQTDETKDLSVRVWRCPHCYTVHDRDHNAAINILMEGKRMVMENKTEVPQGLREVEPKLDQSQGMLTNGVVRLDLESSLLAAR